MALRDPLLQLVLDLSTALDVEMKRNNYISKYEDVKLGNRNLCSLCGITFDDVDVTFRTANHQSWCRLGKNLKLLDAAKSHLGLDTKS